MNCHSAVAQGYPKVTDAAHVCASHAGQLPFTGANLVVFVAMGLLLIAFGAILHVSGKQFRASKSSK